MPIWKRSLDVACAIAALPLLAVLVFILAVMMSVGSPGPILYRQERIGLRGRRFRLYKFRTMHVGADAAVHEAHATKVLRSNGPMLKLDGLNDPRLMAGAWWLRASGLDELPQIINVLRGEMSLVGPRPCMDYEYSQYTEAERQRCAAVPGLTGLWQVSGKNHTTFAEMVRLDVLYAERKSRWLDAQILAATLPALLRQIRDTRRERQLVPEPVNAESDKPIATG